MTNSPIGEKFYEEKIMKRITKNSFEKWLAAKSPRTKVGYNEYQKTPIDRFIKQNGASTESLPVWAVNFQNQALARSGRSISARAALSMLS